MADKMPETEEDTSGMESDISELTDYLSEALSGHRQKIHLEDAKNLVKTSCKSLGHRKSLCTFKNKDGATALDLTMRYGDMELTSTLLDMCPELVTSEVEGQALRCLALLAFGNKEVNVKLSENIALSDEKIDSQGPGPDSNVMAEQRPLLKAALKLKEKGDTLFHGLIRHINKKRELILDAVIMVNSLHRTFVDPDPKVEKQEGEDSVPKPKKQEGETTLPKTKKQDGEISVPKTKKQDGEISVPMKEKQDVDNSLPKKEMQDVENSLHKKAKHDADNSVPKNEKQNVENSVPKKQKQDVENSVPKKTKQNDENSVPRIKKKGGDPVYRVKQDILFVRNIKENMTALQLAAAYGLKPLAEAILLFKDVYYSHSDEDGTYDEKVFDITEIDSLACQKSQLSGSMASKWYAFMPCHKELKLPSILEMIFENDGNGSDLPDIVEMKPIRYLIDLKWKYYRKFYALWLLVHFSFTVLYSIYAVEHSNIHYDNSGTQLQKDFVMVVQWIALLFGFVFLLVGIAAILPRTYKCLHCRKCPPCKRICKFKLFQRWRLFRTHNTDHVLIYIIFAVSVIVESILNIADVQYSGLVMIMAVISCWWFNIFFFGMNKTLTFVAVLFREIILRDVFRICIFIGSQLLVFTAVMHMLYQGMGIPAVDGQEYDPDPENAPTYQMSVFAMLNLMLGLGGIESMDKSRLYAFAVTIYVIFVLLTHIIFFNALIATTSTTCAEIANDEERRFVLNRLSMILYMEDVLTIFLTWLDPLSNIDEIRLECFGPGKSGTDEDLNRYILDMRTPSKNKSVKDNKNSQDKKTSSKISRKNATSVYYICEILKKSILIFEKKRSIQEYIPGKTVKFTVTGVRKLKRKTRGNKVHGNVVKKVEKEDEDVDEQSEPIIEGTKVTRGINVDM